MNWNKIRQNALWIHKTLNHLRGPMYVALVIGLFIFVFKQNFRFEDTSIRALLSEAALLSVFGMGCYVARLTRRPMEAVCAFLAIPVRFVI